MLSKQAFAGMVDNSEYVKLKFLLGRVEGTKMYAGVSFDIARGWDVYYKDPGDVGIPTTLSFSDGVEVLDTHWPTPRANSNQIGDKTFKSNVYYDKLVLPLTLKTNSRNGVLRFDVTVSYAVCNNICIPETQRLSLQYKDGNFVDARIIQELDQWKKK